MRDSLVRICAIELKGFKNIEYGLIEMASTLNKAFFSTKSDILGIYGQNGSGKTAIIEAMGFIQNLLMGEPLPKETVQYISREMNSCSIVVTFAVAAQGRKSKVEYTVTLERLDNDGFEIAQESLSAAALNGVEFGRKRKLLCFNAYDEGPAFTPNFRYNELINHDEKNRISLGVAKKIAQKEHSSFIFNKESKNLFLEAPEEITADYAYIIAALHRYSCINLFVISNDHAGSISMNFLLPFAFRMEMGERIAKGSLPVRLDAPSLLSKEEYGMIQKIISEMNTVLGTLVPGLSIGIHDFGEQLLEDSSVGHKIQLVSKRGEVVVPLKYESEGIIKIISILNALMCIFNNPSMCLIIDELDAGIFEYLLGELLSVFDKGAKGQLIFTSHNLRALEMLNKSSIVFSTTNPKKRYIRLQNVKTNNNLRDLYLRSITLGGQKEEVYAETDTVEMGRAFRRAGKAVRGGQKD
jgi:energy-coupling factor transporter ATP-binding protein EcfA2